MARGLPAVWSSILGFPLVAGGVYVYVTDPHPTVPPEIGLPMIAFGLFIFLIGLYVHFIAAPEPPAIRDGEKLIERRHPSQRVARTTIAVGMLFLFVAGYLLYGTFYPYVYPMATFLVGLYFFSTGLYAYWTNTLTTYYVTNQRVIKTYRFISLVRAELPFDKVRGVAERKSVWEALVGLGNVRVASGGSQTLEIVIRNIESPTEFADEIRNLI